MEHHLAAAVGFLAGGGVGGDVLAGQVLEGDVYTSTRTTSASCTFTRRSAATSPTFAMC